MRVEVIEFHPDPSYDFQLIPGEKYDVAWGPDPVWEKFPFREPAPRYQPHITWLYRGGMELVGEIGWARFRVADSRHSFEAYVLVDKP